MTRAAGTAGRAGIDKITVRGPRVTIEIVAFLPVGSACSGAVGRSCPAAGIVRPSAF